MVDVVLSSGYLAFGRHVGFLDAAAEAGLPIGGLCGTSSGAVVASLHAAGWTADQIARELTSRSPLSAIRPHRRPWRGWFSLRPAIDRLREILPPRFEDLRHPLGIGVMLLDHRTHLLLRSGPLPEAVAASCAIPGLFAPVQVDRTWYADGGLIDRLGLAAWRQLRGERPTVVHLVARSRGSGRPIALGPLPVVRSPRSGAGLRGLGEFERERAETRERARPVLRSLVVS